MGLAFLIAQNVKLPDKVAKVINISSHEDDNSTFVLYLSTKYQTYTNNETNQHYTIR